MTGINVDGRGATVDGRGVQAGEVGGDLRDSAVHRWKADEGSGSTAADSIGSVTMNVGSNWITNNYQGGAAFDFAGTSGQNDVADADHPTLDQYLENAHALCFTLDNYNQSDYQQILHHQPDGTNGFEYSVSFSNSSSGNLDMGARRASGYGDDQIGIDISGQSGKLRVLFGVDTSGTMYLAINGGSIQRPGGNTNYEGGSPVFKWGEGSDPANYDGVVDDIILYDEEPSDDLSADDYSLQPWS